MKRATMLYCFVDVLVAFKKYSFSNRITNMWNSLPDSVVMAYNTVNQFKNRLDKHWANYVFLYDYIGLGLIITVNLYSAFFVKEPQTRCVC